MQSNSKDLWLQIVDKSSQKVFKSFIIYRDPKGNVYDFISALNEKLLQNNNTQKYYICNDLNIDINPMNCSNNASTHSQMVASNGAYSLTDKSIRITNTSKTIIAHVITNDNRSIILYPFIFLSVITDQYPMA